MSNSPKVCLVAQLSFGEANTYAESCEKCKALFGVEFDPEDGIEVKDLKNPDHWETPSAHVLNSDDDGEIYPIYVSEDSSKEGDIFIVKTLLYCGGEAMSVAEVNTHAKRLSDWCESKLTEHGFTYSVYLTPGYG